MKLHELIFPSLNGIWAEINLNDSAKSFHPEWIYDRNPLIDSAKQIEFVADMHHRMNCQYSYGGWLEDRSTLWRGHYLDADKMIHLGVDFNVPADTEVRLPFGGDIVYIGQDEDQNGGWGGRLDFRSRIYPFYFIIGHLDPDSIWEFQPSKKKRNWYGWYPTSHIVGIVGSSSVNGGWFPHIHLQCMSYQEYESYKFPEEIDGYGSADTDIEKRFLNPHKCLSFAEDYKLLQSLLECHKLWQKTKKQ